jgi:hypothetical protein
MGKRWKRKRKRWPQVWPSSSLSGGNSFSIAQRYNRRWFFGLSIRWCNMLWPCFVLCASVPSRADGTSTRICVERGVGGIVAITPVAVEVCMSSWWNDRVMLGQGVVSVLLFTVHGHVRPIGGSGCHGMGAPVAPCLARGLHMFLGWGGSTPRGSGALMTSWGLERGENCRPRRLSRPRPLCKARAGWRLTFVSQAIDLLSAPLADRFYQGPYNGVLANVQGAVFRHLLGTLVFWYPTVCIECQAKQ